jgi:predicted phosphodiesterase
MRILALYDIHGNADALDAVLADPRAQDRDAVVVGGDVVPGAFAADVLERLDALAEPAHWLRGNGEREVAEAADPDGGSGDPDPDDLPLVTATLTARALDPARVAALGALPLTVVLDGVLYCHATPRSDEELLTRLSPPDRYDTALAGVEQGLVVAGHTHQQHEHTTSGGIRFVNAGSVGLPYQGDGAARWLLVDDGEPHLMSTTYDHAAAGARILASGWPDTDSTAAAMTELIPALTITELFESRTT